MEIRFSTLPAEWQMFVRAAREAQFGEVLNLEVAGGLPVLGGDTEIVIDRLLGKKDVKNTELEDFALKERWLDLFDICNKKKKVLFKKIVIRDGLPYQAKYAVKLEDLIGRHA